MDEEEGEERLTQGDKQRYRQINKHIDKLTVTLIQRDRQNK